MVSELLDGVGQGQSEGLEGDLRDRVDGEVRSGAGTRDAYSTDASNIRQVPVGVVLPRAPEAAVESVAVGGQDEPLGSAAADDGPGQGRHDDGGRSVSNLC